MPRLKSNHYSQIFLILHSKECPEGPFTLVPVSVNLIKKLVTLRQQTPNKKYGSKEN